MDKNLTRREFTKTGTAGMGLIAAVKLMKTTSLSAQRPAAASSSFKVKPLKTVRVGFIGTGNQGMGHVRNLLRMDGVELKAVCDLEEKKILRAKKFAKEEGKKEPDGYFSSDKDYLKVIERNDIDLIFTATPWELHTPICVAAMKSGKHAVTEVPAALTIEDCWKLVETSEKTKRYCVMMENCCYDRIEMMILNMVRKNVLGEMMHAECGYLHDLRGLKFAPKYYWNQWRLKHSYTRNGDLYPTHGIGPVAWWMNINRGNQFDHLVSMATRSSGMNLFAEEKFGADSHHATRKYALGDITQSMIYTKQGQTIIVTHDCSLPRPYTRNIIAQGTKGIVQKYPKTLVHVHGRVKGHKWEEVDEYLKEFEHPLWIKMEEMKKKAAENKVGGIGHGGMDFLENFRLIQCLHEGKPLDLDVYDAASWSSISALSEKSIANRSKTMDFPDFTKGKWKNRPPLVDFTGA